jgi:hypothetical protein
VGYEDHPVFEKPDDPNAIVWRYLDFTKLVSLLDRRELFFCRVDKLEDPLEGSTSRSNPLLRPAIYKDIPEPQRRIAMESYSNLIRDLRKFTFVDCWNLYGYESAAMWRLYLSSDEGVAIRSTFDRLCAAIGEPNAAVYVGKVKYADYDTDWLPEDNIMQPFIHKRRSFEHEREVRALIQLLEAHSEDTREEGAFPEGMRVPVDLDVLVEAIHVSPAAPDGSWGS